MLTNQVSLVLLIVYMVAGLVLYHKFFVTIYFDLAGGLFRELATSFFFSLIMTGLTLYKWKIALVVIIIGGIIVLGKCSSTFMKGTVILGTIILAGIIIYAGKDFSNRMNQSEEAENQKESIQVTDRNNKKNNYENSNNSGTLWDNEESEDEDEEYTSDDIADAENRLLGQYYTESDEETLEDEDEEYSEEDTNENDDYILENSSQKLLTKKQVKALSKEECRYARNEIYARHGRMFNDPELQDYFDGKSWYERTIKPEKFKESILNSIEKKNVKLLMKYENGR